ncbi:hypothetical protein [Ornithinimicrobium avium]|uniref:Uncharacterized protein n=1 Tax=Ornithinimicrobium avium TaxID=2283195 RepID=A0A345NN91_9MICO|nr:hypothetical protein [Ornithinimicrobium avium]AXH96499.1 hypothetical protein DV701_10505 [Ornithinimicrobium avium]
MSTTVRTGLAYGVAAVAALVVGLILDSGLLFLLAAVIVVLGFLHVYRGRALAIEHERAEEESTVRDGNGPPEGHGGW